MCHFRLMPTSFRTHAGACTEVRAFAHIRRTLRGRHDPHRGEDGLGHVLDGVIPAAAPELHGHSFSSTSLCIVPNLFVTGWIKRGPTGIIATNKWDAEETAETMLETMYADGASGRAPGPGNDGLERLFKLRNVPWVSSDGWSAIDAEEMRLGLAEGRPRVKIGDWESLLEHGRAGGWTTSDAAGEGSS